MLFRGLSRQRQIKGLYLFAFPKYKDVKSINAKFFENDDFSGNTNVREIIFEKTNCDCSNSVNRIDDVHFVRDNHFVRGNVEPKPVLIPNDPTVNQPAKLNVEISLRRWQHIRRPTLFDDHVYLHESDSNIGKSSYPNSFDEVVSCSNCDNWVRAM